LADVGDGVAMSAMGVAAVLAQTPAWAVIDRTRRKRSWMVAASADRQPSATATRPSTTAFR
jgi:hypothetical protein